MVRAGLARDASAALLATTDQLDAAGGRDVQNVNAGASQFGQDDLAEDHDFFRCGRHAAQPETHALEALVHDAAALQVVVFGMAEYRLIEHPAVVHRPPHD